ncbi:MAG: hydrolase [Aquabacterium sp.]|uniref:CocE/NonD family hydrolase n=1 Tax=Aquabacterium sp. TaxID=1872578 RepID=UPI0025C3F853|nr:CocE/NonD family hydrolase [Aquabacterium sp.]MBI3381365.1 hydrolase [Aquabacterium sp.]
MSKRLSALLGAGLSLCAVSASAAITCEPLAAGETYKGYLASPGKINPDNGTCWVNKLSITTHDGVKLTANVFLPKISSPDQKVPTIIMVNSWVCPDWEYIGQAYRLAKDGYMVIEYASRGWWKSEGITSVASPDDIKDVSDIVDWLGANTPVDPDNIAISGISYGAGISLLGLARESRIKTAAALSGWSSLEEQLYFQETTNKSNLNLLVGVAPVAGKLDPEVKVLQADLLNPDTTQQRADEIRAWARPRSPLYEIDKLNARRAPVFLSKNYSDEMFTPNSTLDLFSQLQGPKKILLNRGWHATAEALGALLGTDNYVYDQAHRWFDYWLKGKDNGIMAETQVDMEIGNGIGRERLATWPDSTVQSLKYTITPRGNVRFDLSCLCTKGINGGLQTATSTQSGTDTLSSSADTVATTGIPLVSELLSGIEIFPMTAPALVNRANGVVYNGPKLGSTLKLRGIPKVQLNMRPAQSQAQVLAYLYDVDEFGIGKLITHSARSVHWATPGKTISFPLDFHMMSYNVAKGHHLSLIIDTKDLHYAPANKTDFKFDLVFGATTPASLTIPYIN